MEEKDDSAGDGARISAPAAATLQIGGGRCKVLTSKMCSNQLFDQISANESIINAGMVMMPGIKFHQVAWVSLIEECRNQIEMLRVRERTILLHLVQHYRAQLLALSPGGLDLKS